MATLPVLLRVKPRSDGHAVESTVGDRRQVDFTNFAGSGGATPYRARLTC